MPVNFRKRAEHFYFENERVKKGKEAWINGDITEFGKLVSESGKSSIELYEAGSELLIDLYNIIVNIKGVYGTRFMGGGFNGACLAIINPKYEENIIKEIKEKYSIAHQDYASKIKIFVCETSDGVGE